MKIVLIRHLKVNYRWKTLYTSDGFERACAGYNGASVAKPRAPLDPVRLVIASDMRRAVDTARLLFGREPDRATGLLAEVPMNPFRKTSLFLPRVVWDALARLQWLAGAKTQLETYSETKRRVKVFIDELLAAGSDCVVISHGWVLKVMMRRLRALGFRGPRPAYLDNGVPFEYRRRQAADSR